MHVSISVIFSMQFLSYRGHVPKRSLGSYLYAVDLEGKGTMLVNRYISLRKMICFLLLFQCLTIHGHFTGEIGLRGEDLNCQLPLHRLAMDHGQKPQVKTIGSISYLRSFAKEAMTSLAAQVFNVMFRLAMSFNRPHARCHSPALNVDEPRIFRTLCVCLSEAFSNAGRYSRAEGYHISP